ncbi:hypothetical protein ACR9E3_08060 [Actinomycetospora sp. C-140]
MDAESCDGYVVVVVRRETGEADCYGPFDEVADAAEFVMRAREESAAPEFDDVDVDVLRWHRMDLGD